MDDIGLNGKKCAVCGKIFYPAPMHVYKRYFGSKYHIKWFCKYSCMLEWDRRHPRRYKTVT